MVPRSTTAHPEVCGRLHGRFPRLRGIAVPAYAHKCEPNVAQHRGAPARAVGRQLVESHAEGLDRFGVALLLQVYVAHVDAKLAGMRHGLGFDQRLVQVQRLLMEPGRGIAARQLYFNREAQLGPQRLEPGILPQLLKSQQPLAPLDRLLQACDQCPPPPKCVSEEARAPPCGQAPPLPLPDADAARLSQPGSHAGPSGRLPGTGGTEPSRAERAHGWEVVRVFVDEGWEWGCR